MTDLEDKARPQSTEDEAKQAESSTEPLPATQQNVPDERETPPGQGKQPDNTPVESRMRQAQARGPRAQGVLNFLLMIFTGLLTVITFWQYQLGQDLLRLTESNERPWVSVEPEMVQPLAFDKEGNLGLNIQLSVKNVGKSVALDVLPWMEMVFLDPDGKFSAAFTRLQEGCEEVRTAHSSPNSVAGATLFPETNSRFFTYAVGKWAKEITQVIARAPPANKGKVGFALVGCVSYRASFEDREQRRHQTRFLYSFGRRVDNANIDDLMKPQGTPEGIALRHRYWADLAD